MRRFTFLGTYQGIKLYRQVGCRSLVTEDYRRMILKADQRAANLAQARIRRAVVQHAQVAA